MAKKKTRRILLTIALCMILTLVCLFQTRLNVSAVEVVDSGTCGENLTWTLDDEGTLTISGSGRMVNSDLFDEPWYPVCDSIKSVIIEHGVLTIGKAGFSDCSNLISVTIPDSVYCIADYAFYGCSSLTSLTLPNSVESIGGGAFSYCSNLSSINIPYSVTSIQHSVFSNCYRLTSVTIPDGVTSIGDYAFYACSNLTSIAIPDSVEIIENSAFIECSDLLRFQVSASNKNFCNDSCGVLFNKNKTTLIKVPEGIAGKYSIPDCTTAIGDYAISYCHNLTSVIIPDSIISIGSDAFFGCDSLTSISIPDSVISIGDYAFYECDSLYFIAFEGNMPTIGSGAFYEEIATVYYPANNTTWTKEKRQDYDGEITWVAYNPLKITAQPKTGYAAAEKYAKTTVKATGDGLTYQWYVKDVGDTKYSKSSQNTTTYACKMNATTNGRYAKCKITDQYGCSVWTNTVRLWIKISITGQPKTGYAAVGKYAKTTVQATGNELTYQWYVKDVGDTKYSKSSQNTATYACKMSATTNGRYAKCKITDKNGKYVWTDTVRLWAKAGITTQPANKTVKEGTTAKFTVKAVGKGLSYQWQYRTSSSGSWKNASATGNKTKTLSVPATVSRHGYQYRCKITDSAGNTVTTKVVKLYVLGIKTQPASKSVKVGATAKFTVKATGKGLAYQWQYKTSDGSWKNVSASSGKTASYSLTAKSRHNGYFYRCKITDSAGNVIYTNIVKLTVK